MGGCPIRQRVDASDGWSGSSPPPDSFSISCIVGTAAVRQPSKLKQTGAAPVRCSMSPYLNLAREPPCHGGYTGSNPVGDSSFNCQWLYIWWRCQESIACWMDFMHVTLGRHRQQTEWGKSPQTSHHQFQLYYGK